MSRSPAMAGNTGVNNFSTSPVCVLVADIAWLRDPDWKDLVQDVHLQRFHGRQMLLHTRQDFFALWIAGICLAGFVSQVAKTTQSTSNVVLSVREPVPGSLAVGAFGRQTHDHMMGVT